MFPSPYKYAQDIPSKKGWAKLKGNPGYFTPPAALLGFNIKRLELIVHHSGPTLSSLPSPHLLASTTVPLNAALTKVSGGLSHMAPEGHFPEHFPLHIAQCIRAPSFLTPPSCWAAFDPFPSCLSAIPGSSHLLFTSTGSLKFCPGAFFSPSSGNVGLSCGFSNHL